MKRFYAIGDSKLLKEIRSSFRCIDNHVHYISNVSDMNSPDMTVGDAVVADFSGGVIRNSSEGIFVSLSKWLLQLWQEYEDITLCPVKVRLDASTVCQLRCSDCYMRKWNNGTLGSGFLKYDDFNELIMKNPQIQEIELSNSGEVFLNPEMERIIDCAQRHGIIFTVHNGNNFNSVDEKVLEKIVSSGIFKNISVSIDGVTQETYEKYRVGGRLDKVLRNVEKLNYYKQKYKTNKPEIIWSFILFEHNEQELPKVKAMAEKYSMGTYFKIDWSGKYKPHDVDMVREITGFDFERKRDEYDLNASLNNTFCRQMFFSPQINWDGRLLGCCVLFNNDWNVNVFEKGLEYCLNSGSYKDMLMMMLGGSKVDDGVPCKGCRHYDAFNKGALIFR